MRPRMVLVLMAILLVAAALRFGGLGVKPLWLDEAMTVLVALGRGPDDVPLGVARPLADLAAIFALDPAATMRDVVLSLSDPAIQHTHPPLFYVLAHAWLRWWSPATIGELTWALRALAAAFGVVAVALVFGLARSAFGDRVAWITVALAAVSPGMVMVSQEGRNYTLPLALEAAALWAIAAIANRLGSRRPVPVALWAAWVGLSVAACYAHYYSTLAFAAQALALAILAVRERSWRELWRIGASAAAVVAAFLPWAATLLTHSVSPEQRWMRLKLRAGPLGMIHDTLHAWRHVVAGLSWEGAHPLVAAATQVATFSLGVWILVVLIARARRWSATTDRPAAGALLLAAGITLAGLFAASLAYQKNFLLNVRFHFAYYPVMAAVLGWLVAGLPERASWRRALTAPPMRTALLVVLMAGAVNAVASDAGLANLKSTRPERMAAALATATAAPVLVVVGSGSFHESVMQLTYLIELARQSPVAADTAFALVPRSALYMGNGRPAPPAIFWEAFASMAGVTRPPATVWVDGTSFRKWDYPARLDVRTAGGERRPCAADREDLARPYEDEELQWQRSFRLYHCAPVSAAAD